MKVFYSRVSTLDQNDSRQLQELAGFDYILTDKCSGAIPIFERPKGAEIKKLIDTGKLTLLEVHSIDRLGRSTIDVLKVWKDLTEKNITIICRNPNLRNFTEDGIVDNVSTMIISILSIMGDFERKLSKERQAEGIAIAKALGKYKGRPIETKDTKEKFLAKKKSKQIAKKLEKGRTLSEIASDLKTSYATISKVKALMSIVEEENNVQ